MVINYMNIDAEMYGIIHLKQRDWKLWKKHHLQIKQTNLYIFCGVAKIVRFIWVEVGKTMKNQGR
jgi:hypothetical protein